MNDDRRSFGWWLASQFAALDVHDQLRLAAAVNHATAELPDYVAVWKHRAAWLEQRVERFSDAHHTASRLITLARSNRPLPRKLLETWDAQTDAIRRHEQGAA